MFGTRPRMACSFGLSRRDGGACSDARYSIHMTDSVSERTNRLPEDLVARETIELARSRGTVTLLPDRVTKHEGRTLAAFRPDTAELRAVLRDSGVGVELAAAPDAELATYSEHSADWVLPVVLFVSGIPVGVVTGVIANWLTVKLGTDAKNTIVHYREGHVRTDGSIDVVEVSGPRDEIAKLLKERGD